MGTADLSGSNSDGHAETAQGAATSSSGGGDLFSPSGLKVLVVDDDPMCLKVVSAMLQRCHYEVETRSSGEDALLVLRERQDQNHQFDLVLSDVYMPDMDGFKLLEQIGLELDLPVIMMSSNGDTNVVLRGVTHGAVDFLIKPVRVEELRNVWQHVVRRRSLHHSRAADEHSGLEVDHHHHGTKRKEAEALQVQHETQGANKKPRVVWSVEMHQQFVDAVNQLGVDKAVPKRILDLMNVAGLTRENVASHLQKYRLYLKRAQGLQNGKGAKGHKAAQEAAMLDPQAAAAAAAVAAGAGPSSVFAQVAAQQAAMAATQPSAAAMQQAAMQQAAMQQGMQQGMPPVMGMPGAQQAMAAAWQQQTMAMQAAAAAAAASGALPPPGAMPFPMPPGAMMPPHMAAMAGMQMGMMGPGMDGSAYGMMYGQQQAAMGMQAAAAAAAAHQACQAQQQAQAQAQQQQAAEQQAAQQQGAEAAAAAAQQQTASPPQQQTPAGVKMEPGSFGVSGGSAGTLHPSAASALTADSGLASHGSDKSGGGLGTGDGAAVPDDDPLSGVGVGPLGDMPESLLNALNPDAFLAETSLPLPRLDGGMDDFLDSFLTSDKALEGGLGESL